MHHDPNDIRSGSPRRKFDYGVAYDQLPFHGTGEAYDYQYNTQFDPDEYDQNYYDDPYADPYPPVEPEADQDGSRSEPLVEEGETVEHGRSWRPENSGSRPPGEAAETDLSS